jgi:hypothetical protein
MFGMAELRIKALKSEVETQKMIVLRLVEVDDDDVMFIVVL